MITRLCTNKLIQFTVVHRLSSVVTMSDKTRAVGLNKDGLDDFSTPWHMTDGAPHSKGYIVTIPNSKGYCLGLIFTSFLTSSSPSYGRNHLSMKQCSPSFSMIFIKSTIIIVFPIDEKGILIFNKLYLNILSACVIEAIKSKVIYCMC